MKDLILSFAQKIVAPPPMYGAERAPGWAAVRDAFLEEHPYCAVCTSQTGAEAHHILPYHLFPELELDPGNLITLCRRPGWNCHFLFGHLGDWRSYNPDVRRVSAQMQLLILQRPRP